MANDQLFAKVSNICLAHLLPVPGSCSAAGCSSCCPAAGCSSCCSGNSSPCGSLRIVRTRIPSAERSADTSPAWIPSVRQYLNRQQFESNTPTYYRSLHTEKQEKKIFLVYKEVQMKSVAKSYTRKGLPNI
jgi:hypothetical protein